MGQAEISIVKKVGGSAESPSRLDCWFLPGLYSTYGKQLSMAAIVLAGVHVGLMPGEYRSFQRSRGSASLLL